MKFINRLPDLADVGKLFFLRWTDGKSSRVNIVEIRWDEQMKDFYFCKECNSGGWHKTSYGDPVRHYKLENVSLAGPIEMPDGVKNYDESLQMV
jgi:hypothetical protein